MNISKRIDNMTFSEIRKFIPYSDEAKERGIEVYHLNIGQPDIKTPEEFFEAIKSFDGKTLKYENSHGIKELINSFIKYYKSININLDKDDILITNGASEGILFALLTLCDFGDEIIVPEPYYTNYNNMAKMAGVKINSFRTYREDGFHIKSRDEILRNISPNTKAMLICNPGNPTGVVYTREEVRLLCDIAVEKDLFIIVDEVYREFVYGEEKFTSFMYMEDVQDRIVLVDSISKRYSACGARIGMLVCKNKLVSSEFMKLSQTRLSVSSLDQIGAAKLIDVTPQYLSDVNKEYEKRRDVLYEGLISIPGVSCEKPSGAFYIIAKLPLKDTNHFTKWLLTDFNLSNKTVMITPAAGFYSTEGLGLDEVRLSYCINCEDLKASIEILRHGIIEYKKHFK